jgi:hypothetical protein
MMLLHQKWINIAIEFVSVAFLFYTQLRRGAERAEIYSIAFSWNAFWLAVSSDKGTVHIFGLHYDHTRTNGKNVAASIINANPGSTLSFMKG